MSEQKPTFEKGDRAAIVRGSGAGIRGDVFWVGDNKYGPGKRYGLKSEDGQTHWVDDASIGREDDAPPAPPPAADGGSAGLDKGTLDKGTLDKGTLDKGTMVKITGGRSGVGVEGAIFWVGKSKRGPGMRYGVKDADGEAHWVDESEIQVVKASSTAGRATPRSGSGAPRSGSGAPRSGPASDRRPSTDGYDDALPPEAYETGGAPGEFDHEAAFGTGHPVSDDDLPPEAFAEENAGADEDIPY